MFDKLITSSSDPEKLSATVKGLLVSVLPIIMLLTHFNEMEANTLITNISNLVFFLTAGYSAGMTVFGLLRKLYHGRWSAPVDSEMDVTQ